MKTFNHDLVPLATHLAQEALNQADLLLWATVACTYTDEDNMQLCVMHPAFKNPIVLGFATFRGLNSYETLQHIRPMINDAIKGARHANGLIQATT